MLGMFLRIVIVNENGVMNSVSVYIGLVIDFVKCV